MAEVTVQNVREAGVVGAGGAGFPTHVKLSAKADTIIVNAAECEPLLHKDKETLRRFPESVVEGLAAAMRLTGAGRGFIGIKEKYQDVMDILRPLLPEGMSIAPLVDAYPAGDEFILTYDVTGRVIPPGGIPIHVGVVTINVETALNIAVSATCPVVVKQVSVAGAVERPSTLRVPVGVSLRQCVEACGGATVSDPNYLVGGVMMGRLEADPDALITKTTGGIVILPGDHYVTRRYRREWTSMARIGRSACDQCSFCTELCPRYLLGHPIEPHKAMRSLMFTMIGEPNTRGTSYCCECNLCSLWSCPEDLDPKSTCSRNKKRLAEMGAKWDSPPFNPDRPGVHMANRKVPIHRLMQKLGLAGFQNVGPMVEEVMAAGRDGIAHKQHVGAPGEPVVQVGQSVKIGEAVGRPPVKDGKPALGAPVHASITGKVTAIQDGVVWIER